MEAKAETETELESIIETWTAVETKVEWDCVGN